MTDAVTSDEITPFTVSGGTHKTLETNLVEQAKRHAMTLSDERRQRQRAELQHRVKEIFGVHCEPVHVKDNEFIVGGVRLSIILSVVGSRVFAIDSHGVAREFGNLSKFIELSEQYDITDESHGDEVLDSDGAHDG